MVAPAEHSATAILMLQVTVHAFLDSEFVVVLDAYDMVAEEVEVVDVKLTDME